VFGLEPLEARLSSETYQPCCWVFQGRWVLSDSVGDVVEVGVGSSAFEVCTKRKVAYS